MGISERCRVCDGVAVLVVDATRHASGDDFLAPSKFRFHAAYCPSCGREIACKPTASADDVGMPGESNEIQATVFGDGKQQVLFGRRTNSL